MSQLVKEQLYDARRLVSQSSWASGFNVCYFEVARLLFHLQAGRRKGAEGKMERARELFCFILKLFLRGSI